MTGIQPKDIPIVILAFRHHEQKPTIFTKDIDLTAFTPGEYNLSELVLKDVD